MKKLIDTLDHISWEIYNDKKRALLANDPETNFKVAEGRDLMSVLRTCSTFRVPLFTLPMYLLPPRQYVLT